MLPAKAVNIGSTEKMIKYSSDNMKIDSLIVTNNLSFFDSPPVDNMNINYNTESIHNLLINLGLTPKNSWTQLNSKIVGTGNIGNSEQGTSVSLSNDETTIASGGSEDDGGIGATWIFIKSKSIITQQGSKLVGTGNIGNSKQGISVSLSENGNTLAVGGPEDNSNIGATWIFTRIGETWTQQGSKLVGTGNIGNSKQGTSVILSDDGNTLAIGGPEDNSNIGATWIFTRIGETWTQQGSKLVGTGNTGISNQGTSVSLSGDGNTLVFGGPTNNTNIGATWVFLKSGTIWTQQQMLIGDNFTNSPLQGSSVSISNNGNRIVIGGPNDSNNIGLIWIYEYNGSIYEQITNIKGTGVLNECNQGFSVFTDDNYIIVGGPNNSFGSGSVWVFYKNDENKYVQYIYKLSTNDSLNNSFKGCSVCIKNNTIVFGGKNDNMNIGSLWIFYLDI